MHATLNPFIYWSPSPPEHFASNIKKTYFFPMCWRKTNFTVLDICCITSSPYHYHLQLSMQILGKMWHFTLLPFHPPTIYFQLSTWSKLTQSFFLKRMMSDASSPPVLKSFIKFEQFYKVSKRRILFKRMMSANFRSILSSWRRSLVPNCFRWCLA